MERNGILRNGIGFLADRLTISLGLIALLICLLGGASYAQNQNSGLPAATDLAEENFSRVAASAAQISLVLHQDTGLMVQLKMWVAKDATTHGQIVSDADLTDQAIYDRLQTDVKFRSVATALLQKYGYLLPQVNPDSALGKQQDLYIQARAKWLAQNQNTEHAPAPATQTPRPNSQLSNFWQPNSSANCQNVPPTQAPGQFSPSTPGGTPSWPSGTSPTPYYPVPLQQSPQNPLLQAQSSPSGLMQTSFNAGSNNFSLFPQNSSMLGGSSYPFHSDLLGLNGLQNGGSSSFNFNGGGMGFGGQGSPFLGEGGMASLLPGALNGMNPQGTMGNDNWFMSPSGMQPMDMVYQSSALTGSPQNFSPPINPRTGLPEYGAACTGTTASTLPYSSASPYPYAQPNPELPNASTLVYRPNPYWEIPSLYDMYQQTLSRPPKPERFGIDVFENGAQDPQLIPMDLPAGPSYIVGPGDGLNIDLWGGVSERLFRVVGREGRISLPEVGPVQVSGKSLGDVQQMIQRVLRTQYRDVSADVSLSLLRTIRVYVVGNVLHPGAYDISSLSTPLNAIFAAGGPTDEGSLRFIQHDRGDHLVQDVDLYDLLLHGVRSGLKPLENGDTVLVPPLGPQVTIEGMVRRPAIYELKNEKTLADVIALAGGLLPSATLRHIEVERTIAHQKRTMLSLNIPATDDSAAVTQKLESFQVQDGDKIRIFPIAPYDEDAVYLEGHVIRPGRYSYHKGMRVTDLIGSYKDLLPEPATQYGEIIRLNPPDYHPSVVSFNLAKALSNPSQSPVLDPLDTVDIFGRFDFENVPTVSVLGDVRDPGTYSTTGKIHLSDAIHIAGGLEPDASKKNAQVFRYLPDGKLKVFSVSLNQALDGNPLDDITLDPRDRILVHKNLSESDPASVYIKGEVARPGRYPLTSNMSVSDLIRAAGGLKQSADVHDADLTRYRWNSETHITGKHEEIELASAMAGKPDANIAMHNGDVLTIRQLPGWDDLGASITVKGEVKNPGDYGIQPGERLSSILLRAGGFAPDAYPYGAILERTAVREMEQKNQNQLISRIQEMQSELKLAPMTDPQQKLAQEAAYQQWQETLQNLNSNPPVGRVSIQISPDIARWKNTSRDITVQAGDVLIVPKRPSYVMVQGQVFNPTAVSFRPGKSAKWYLRQAGGPTNLAYKKGIFVIRADGTVIGGTDSSWWSGGALHQSLQPGDMVMVPEKSLGGPTNWKGVFQMGQVMSAIAVDAILAARYY